MMIAPVPILAVPGCSTTEFQLYTTACSGVVVEMLHGRGNSSSADTYLTNASTWYKQIDCSSPIAKSLPECPHSRSSYDKPGKIKLEESTLSDEITFHLFRCHTIHCPSHSFSVQKGQALKPLLLQQPWLLSS
ncbi:hypothetical protein R3W88_016996 [Solanum pinnatisectum]|uniref:Uncharacterized protein n=1 Tax=Solanum pinnatisectum TaxID=50273 RepID=A0AAV9KZ22_9SOLN|nr:hypothetical protein R3W88_016996 [Solanum pinnatisectum]